MSREGSGLWPPRSILAPEEMGASSPGTMAAGGLGSEGPLIAAVPRLWSARPDQPALIAL